MNLPPNRIGALRARQIGEHMLDELQAEGHQFLPGDLFALAASLLLNSMPGIALGLTTNASEYLASLKEETDWTVVGREVLLRTFFDPHRMEKYGFPPEHLTEEHISRAAELLARLLKPVLEGDAHG